MITIRYGFWPMPKDMFVSDADALSDTQRAQYYMIKLGYKTENSFGRSFTIQHKSPAHATKALLELSGCKRNSRLVPMEIK